MYSREHSFGIRKPTKENSRSCRCEVSSNDKKRRVDNMPTESELLQCVLTTSAFPTALTPSPLSGAARGFSTGSSSSNTHLALHLRICPDRSELRVEREACVWRQPAAWT